MVPSLFTVPGGQGPCEPPGGSSGGIGHQVCDGPGTVGIAPCWRHRANLAAGTTTVSAVGVSGQVPPEVTERLASTGAGQM